MNIPPRRLAAGEPVTAAAYNALLDFARRCLPIAGQGVRVSTKPAGSLVEVTGARAPAAPGERYGTFRWKKNTGSIGEGDDAHPLGTVSFCHYQFGRAVYEISDKEDVRCDEAQTLYLVIPHEEPDAAVITKEPEGVTNADQTVIPLFDLDERGDISKDYRAMPVVPVWGSETT